MMFPNGDTGWHSNYFLTNDEIEDIKQYCNLNDFTNEDCEKKIQNDENIDVSDEEEDDDDEQEDDNNEQEDDNEELEISNEKQNCNNCKNINNKECNCNENEQFYEIENKKKRNKKSKKVKKKQQNTKVKQKKRKRITCLQYYKYRLMVRGEGKQKNNLLHSFGKLFQQYVVDQYAKTETNNLNYLRYKGQDRLRKAYTNNLRDAIKKDTVKSCGKKYFLPSSFQSGMRWFHQKYQDAMSIVQRYGKPDLFITMTCNTKWPEIQKHLFANQTAYDRPDLVARVFHHKKEQFLEKVLKGQVFGKVVAHVHVVEFQKRGLPHMHLLLILDKKDKPKIAKDYDKFVLSEIPDKDKYPRLFKSVISHMIHWHTPMCSKKQNECSKYYPKDFWNDSTTEKDDGYPIYQRRDEEHGGKTVRVRKKGKTHEIDNRYVVAYNPALLLTFDCHINVEICSTIKSIKYLYKYVYKGADRCMITLENGDNDDSGDEIKQYLNCRYISAIEACHRLLSFRLHDRHPTVTPLAVHLPEQVQVIYNKDGNILEWNKAIELANKTTLTGWMRNNKKEIENPLPEYKLGRDINGNLNPRGPDLHYWEYLLYY